MGVVRSATMVTAWPQCGQSRVVAGCGLASTDTRHGEVDLAEVGNFS